MNTLLIKNGTCVLPGRTIKSDVLIKNGKIVEVGSMSSSQEFRVDGQIDATGLHVLPGIIDSQVHFREPGLTHKEDLESGSKAAALGGITSFYEMPNTYPPTTSVAAIKEKLAIAKIKSIVNYGFFIGATDNNLEELIAAKAISGCVGIKIFLGSSTGSLLLHEREKLKEIFLKTDAPIAIHAEDEGILNARLSIKNAAKSALEHPHWRNVESAFAATKMIVELARQTNRRIHILHVSTREEMEYLALHKDLVSVEVTPQHLTLHSPDCYERLGTYAQMNPPIREKVHQDGLWWGIRQGIADVIGSDHAPHTKEEKEKGYPNTPSGMPGVQTLVPIMLNHVHEGALSLERFVDMASTRPAQIYRQNKGRIGVGADGDVTIVDLGKRQKISHVDQASRCGWTPYNDMEVYGWPLYTVVAGEIVMAHGELVKTAPV